jgi:4-hydroxybenzoate polyprenyltransferase
MHWWRQFIGSATPGYRQRRREAAGQAILFLLLGFSVAYFVSEFALSQLLHQVHWATAAVSAALMYGSAYTWTLHRLHVQQAPQLPQRTRSGRR